MICIALFAIALAKHVFAQLTHSLWLDELVSVWVASGSAADVWYNSVNYQGQSPLFFLLVSWVIRFIGDVEWQLRLLSFVAELFTVLGMLALSKRFLGLTTGIGAISVYLYLVHSDSLISLSVRPYLLAHTFVVFSMYCFLRWVIEKDNILGWGWVASSLVAYYLHYFTASVFPVFAVVLLYALIKKQMLWPEIVWKLASLAALMVPSLWQLITLGQRWSLYSFAGDVTFLRYVSGVFPPKVTLITLSVFLVGWVISRSKISVTNPDRQTALVYSSIILWIVIPPALIAMISLIGPSVFRDRYFSWNLPALSLLLLTPFKLLKPEREKFLISLLVLVLSCLLLSDSNRGRHHEYWREAIAQIEHSEVPVFLQSGLVETKDRDWIEQHSSYLAAPLFYYHVGNEVRVLTFSPDPSSFNFDSLTGGFYLLAIKTRVVLAGKEYISSDYISELVEENGFRRVEEQLFGSIVIMRFKPTLHLS